MTRQIVGYCRVSTGKQAEEGVSIEQQKSKIEAYAALNDMEVLAIYCDPGISGKTLENRPAALAAIRDACEYKAVLFVYSMSRLSRSTVDMIRIAEKLKAAGAEFVSHTEQIDTTSAAGRMFFKLMAIWDEFQREQIAEKTADALNWKVEVGEAVGSVPYGFKKVNADGSPAFGKRDPKKEPPRVLVPNEDEVPILYRIFERHAAGDGYGKIANDLTADEIEPRGAAWDRGSLRRLLAYYRQPKTAKLRERLAEYMGRPLPTGDAAQPADAVDKEADDDETNRAAPALEGTR